MAETLHVNSTMDLDGKPFVLWYIGNQNGLLTLTEARKQADLIIRACAIAESEAAIVKGMDATVSPKGFEKPKTNLLPWQMLQLIRDFRPPLGEGINAIYGYNTKLPLVEIDWYGDRIQWDIESARHHAYALLITAEASETDAFYFFFLREKVGIERDELQPLLIEFAEFRRKNLLEDLFNDGNPQM